MQKYYNPRLHNAVVAGTGMEHPRRPHVVLGSELNGYVQGDLVDANGICDLIHEKNVDTFAKLESLETSLKNESKARAEGMDNLSEQIDRTIANKLGSTETVYGESVQRAAEDERLQLQINDLNSKYTALGGSLSALNTAVNGKQDALVAGNNIKNISDGTNTVSLLGAGDVRFKTINGQSILGDEDIEVSNAVCDCPYQVIIKGAPKTTRGGVSNVPVFEVIKGDYATAKNKIENGEYVDFVVYIIGHDGVTDDDGDEGYFEDVAFISFRIACSSFIKIVMSSSSLKLYWTADGVSTVRPIDSAVVPSE